VTDTARSQPDVPFDADTVDVDVGIGAAAESPGQVTDGVAVLRRPDRGAAAVAVDDVEGWFADHDPTVGAATVGWEVDEVLHVDAADMAADLVL